MKIAVILPTRGMVFTLVEHAIECMRLSQEGVLIFRSWDLGIPEAQNTLVDEALKVNPDYLLFIEEDTVPPMGFLEDLLDAKADIAFIDYGVNGWSCSARDKLTNEILWCGLGCTLVKREVFDKLEKPYFRTDKSLRLNDWKWIDNPMKYGGQDIWFFTHAREAGYTLTQVEGECQHLQLDSVATREINDGRHVISAKSTIQKHQVIDKPERLDDNTDIGNTPHAS